MGTTSVKNALQFVDLPISTATPTTQNQFITSTYASSNYNGPNGGITYTGTFTSGILFSYSLRSILYDGALSPTLTAVKFYPTVEPAILTFDLGSCGILDSLLSALTALTSLSCPNLKYVFVNFSVTANNLSTYSCPELIAVNDRLTVNSNALTTMSYPKLTYIRFQFTGILPALTSFSAPMFQYIGLNINFQAAVLTTFSLPAIISIGTTVSIVAANLVNFSLGSTLKFVGGNFTLTGAKLNQASVDNILVRLAALDGTNGTTAYSGKTIAINGGTSSAPSATGLTAKATLQARSCTVTTN